MSDSEAAVVVDLISSVISAIEGTKKVFDDAEDAGGQPDAFCQVAARLPLVIDIFKKAKEKALADGTPQVSLELILESCNAKAGKLKKLFQKVIKKDVNKWYDRYKVALRTLEKWDKVEGLMSGKRLLPFVQTLFCMPPWASDMMRLPLSGRPTTTLAGGLWKYVNRKWLVFIRIQIVVDDLEVQPGIKMATSWDNL